MRRLTIWLAAANTLFQSTHSLRSATRRKNVCGKNPDVSIHALLAECDLLGGVLLYIQKTFQSTHSLRSATELDVMDAELEQVSIHALLAECDWPMSGT